MGRALVLEDFATAQPAAASPRGTDAPLGEEARLAAYEEGYKAGWDDAADAETRSRERIAADFGKTLQELSFSFHEARAHVLHNVGPLITMMAEKVLPELGRERFAETVIEIVRQAADNAAEAPVELVVNAANRAAVEGLLEAGSPPLPVTIVEEHTLGPGQAYIRAGGGETAVDIDTVLKEINEAVGGFLGTGPGEERLNHA